MSTNVRTPASWGRPLLFIALTGAACGIEPPIGELGQEIQSGYQAQVKGGVLTVVGGDEDSKLALRFRDGTTVDVDVGDDGTVEFSFDRAEFASILVDGGAGDDVIRIDQSVGRFPLDLPITIMGGSGNDTLLGGDGAETFYGGAGNDTVIPGRGDDVVFLGAGNDTVVWNPGDGSDVVDGEGGTDTMLFNGSNASENMALSADGEHLRLFRDVGNITMDLDNIEVVQINAFGGADHILVNDLAATDVKRVNVDLAGAIGSPEGDAMPDTVEVNGTPTAGTVDVQANGTAVIAMGSTALVSVTNGEPDLDHLVIDSVPGERVNVNGSSADDTISIFGTDGNVGVLVAGFNVLVVPVGGGQIAINGGAGNDTITALGGTPVVPLLIDGGRGNDVIVGGPGDDTLIGGSGNDTITGGRGEDTIFLGEGNDTVIWNPGDGNDLVDGQGGTDTMVFNGSNAPENIDISANGHLVLFHRDVANIDMLLDGVAIIQFNAFGGADNVVVNDLTGTDVKRVNVDLGGTPGSTTGDGQPDAVIVNGAPVSGTINVGADGTAVVATGMSAIVSVVDGEPSLDRLQVNSIAGERVNVNGTAGDDVITVSQFGGSEAGVFMAGFNVTVTPTGEGLISVNGLDGDDIITAGNGLPPINLTLDGGRGNDTISGGSGVETIIGGLGNDVVSGGGGNDTILLGDGDDTFIWNPGDGSDVVEGQNGHDTMIFNGSNVGEAIDLAANGPRLRLFRNVANITMDVNGVETIEVNTIGGQDSLVVNDLTGTSVKSLILDLGQADLPDGVADTVVINGTQNADRIAITADGGSAVVKGLAATIRVDHPDTFDQLVIDALGGVDAISVDPPVNALMTLTVNQD